MRNVGAAKKKRGGRDLRADPNACEALFLFLAASVPSARPLFVRKGWEELLIIAQTNRRRLRRRRRTYGVVVEHLFRLPKD